MIPALSIVRESVDAYNQSVVAGAPMPAPVKSNLPRHGLRVYGAAKQLWDAVVAGSPQTMIHGPAECLAGESQLLNPITLESPTVESLYQRNIGPTVLTGFGSFKANVPFIKGKARLYRVTSASGKSSLVSKGHLFLTNEGWVKCGDLLGDELLLISDVSPLPTNSGFYQKAHQRDAVRCSHKALGLSNHYSAYCCYLCDEQLPLGQGTYQGDFPSLICALLRNGADSQKDDSGILLTRNRLYQLLALLSTEDYSLRTGQTSFDRCNAFLETYGQNPLTPQPFSRSQLLKLLERPTQEFLEYGHSTFRQMSHSTESLGSSSNYEPAEHLYQESPRYGPLSGFENRHQESTSSLNLVNEQSQCKYTAEWEHISSIKFEREDYFYDITVPIAGHYYAEGMWHHNTGKSVGALALLDYLCWTNKDLQGAIIRKVGADMQGTVIQSFERKVIKLPKGANKTVDGISKYGGEKTQFYDYPSGSRIWVGGMDHPGKVLSGERDVVLCNQAEEFEENDWETISTRTTGRGGGLTPGRLIGDCNPGPSTHWILAHKEAGTLEMFASKHQDNPTLFNPVTGEVTEQGKRSLAALDKLTGVRYKRLRLGLWVAAEGVVYEDFDPTIHVIDKPLSDIVRVIAGVDWGMTNPGVIQVWGVDGDDNMYRLAETYQTGKLVADSSAEGSWWINKAKRLRDQYDIKYFLPDPSRPDHIEAFENAGLRCEEVFNSVELGIQNVQSRMMPQGLLKRPRIFFLRGSRDPHPDPELIAAHKPTCTEEEIEVYAYPKDPKEGTAKEKKEEPVAKNNHGCDTMRYVAADVDCLGANEFVFA